MTIIRVLIWWRLHSTNLAPKQGFRYNMLVFYAVFLTLQSIIPIFELVSFLISHLIQNSTSYSSETNYGFLCKDYNCPVIPCVLFFSFNLYLKFLHVLVALYIPFWIFEIHNTRFLDGRGHGLVVRGKRSMFGSPFAFVATEWFY